MWAVKQIKKIAALWLLLIANLAHANSITDYFQASPNWKEMDRSKAGGYTGKGELIAFCVESDASRCYLRETKADVADLGRTEVHSEYRQRCSKKEKDQFLVRKFKLLAPRYLVNSDVTRIMTITSEISTCDLPNGSDFIVATLTYDYSGGTNADPSNPQNSSMLSGLFSKKNKSKFSALTGSYVFTRKWMEPATIQFRSRCQAAYRNSLAEGKRIHEGLIIEVRPNLIQVQDASGKLHWLSKTDLSFPNTTCDPDLLARNS